jgi:hypothetical protein
VGIGGDEHLCEFGEVVGRPRPAHRKASEPPKGAAVIDREIVAVFLPDSKGVLPVREIHGDEVVARAGQVSQVFQGLSCHVELGTLAVELAHVDN